MLKPIYFTESTGPDKAALIAAAAKLSSLTRGRSAALVLHAVGNVDSRIFSDVFGQDFSKNVAKEKRVHVNGTLWHLVTERIRAASFAGGPAIVPFGSTKLLQTTVDDQRANEIVYVPWTDDDLASVREFPGAVAL